MLPREERRLPRETRRLPRETRRLPRETRRLSRETRRLSRETRRLSRETRRLPRETRRWPHETRRLAHERLGVATRRVRFATGRRGGVAKDAATMQRTGNRLRGAASFPGVRRPRQRDVEPRQRRRQFLGMRRCDVLELARQHRIDRRSVLSCEVAARPLTARPARPSAMLDPPSRDRMKVKALRLL